MQTVAEQAKTAGSLMPVLLVVEGDRGVEAAIRKILELRLQREIRVYLLNVRPPFPHYVSRFVSRKSIEQFQVDEGLKALAPAMRLLESAGVPYWKHVESGERAAVIMRFAEERHCRRIFIAQRGHGLIARLLLDSTASHLRELLPQAGKTGIVFEEY